MSAKISGDLISRLYKRSSSAAWTTLSLRSRKAKRLALLCLCSPRLCSTREKRNTVIIG